MLECCRFDSIDCLTGLGKADKIVNIIDALLIVNLVDLETD